MEIGNQQGRLLKINYEAFMLYGITVTDAIRKEFSVEDNLKFIININQGYEYFLSEFGLLKDQVKRTKKKLFDHFEMLTPTGFRPVVGFPKYLVNEFGVVVNKRTRAILRSSLNRKGYPVVCLTGKATETVHRIVAKAWIPNPENKPEVNHIDGNKVHNFVTNLEWSTNAENADHKRAYNLGKTAKSKAAATGSRNSQSKLDEAIVTVILREKNAFKASILSSAYGVSEHTINDIRARRTWKHI